MKFRQALVLFIFVTVTAGCDGRSTLRCDTELECIKRSAAKCDGGEFRLLEHRHNSEPVWWWQARERFTIECARHTSSS
jgi:hypothetical protein